MKKNNTISGLNKRLRMNLQLFAADTPNANAQPQAQPQGQPQGNPNDTTAILSAIKEMGNQLNTIATPQKTAEQVQAEQEALLEEFNSNPAAVLNRFQTQAQEQAMQNVQPMINELSQKMQDITWSDAVRKFAGQNPNAKTYSSQMNEILRTNPAMSKLAKENPMEALNASLSMAMTNSLAPNGNIVEGITANEELMTQILSNPEIKQGIINEYLAQLNGGAPDVPAVAGNSTSAPAVAPTPTNKPKDFKEAQQSALAYFNSLNQAQMQ